jgi:DNA-binding CsgD family transcriptional regulator/tetratricopeptide (TPR) repeat protein
LKVRTVGRSHEIARIEAEWRRAAAGEFRCILLLGEPGEGKTRLMADVLGRHRGDPVVLSGRGHPLGGTAAFGLWAEALERHLRELPVAELDQLCVGLLDDLAGLLLSVAARRPHPLRELSRPRLLEALGALLARLANPAPVLIVLDDMHLADASSWDALHYLANDLAAAPVLVIASARPGELADHVSASRVLFDLEQQDVLLRLRVGPLPPQAIHDLAEEAIEMTPPRRLVEWLAERSRGNPLFALGLVQALLDEGADLAEPVLHSLPEALADRVTTRVRVLDHVPRSTIEVLAVFGRPVELGDLVAAVDTPVDELGRVLEGLVRGGLVTEEERDRKLVYEISHRLVQEAIYEHIGGARRRARHRHVGRVLLALGRLGEAAPHFSRSADIGDAEAIEVLRDALRQTEDRGAWREGLQILGALADVVPRGDERWVEIAHVLSDRAEWVVDFRADTLATMGIRALREIDRVLGSSHDPALRALVKSRLTSFYFTMGYDFSAGTGQLEEAEKACRDAVALFEEAGDQRNALLTALELAYIRANRCDETLETGARRVVQLAEAAGEPFATMRAVGVMGVGAFYRGHFQEAEEALRRSAVAARAGNKVYLTNWSLMCLGWSLGYEGRLEEALRCFEEAKSANPAWRDSNVLAMEACVRWLAGDLRGSLTAMQEVLAGNPGRLVRRQAFGAIFAALSATEGGRLADAREYLDVAWTSVGNGEWVFVRPCGVHAEGVLAWRQGRGRDALATLSGAARRLVATEFRPMASVPLLDAAELAAELGRGDVAREVAEVIAGLAKYIQRDLHTAIANTAAAWGHLAAGDHEAAATPAREAAGALEASGYRILHGRALDTLGRALVDPDRDGALAALRQAATVFDACHATWRRDRSLNTLRDLGGRGRRAAGAVLGLAALTSREREVAGLAAQRLTHREIGDVLFISDRTVQGHLMNVYAKLGVKSKLDFARRAEEFGL